MTQEPSTSVTIEVADDSILAHKTITIKPIGQIKLKHIRSFDHVRAQGKNAKADDMIMALAGFLVGWTEDEIAELSLDEMQLVFEHIGGQQANAVPNQNGSSSPQRSQRTTRGRGRPGYKRFS